MRTNKLLVATLLLLAFVLRWFNAAAISPYWEEVALGYDAYSIATTGRDHHGHPWPLAAFESFGDWKPSLYFYAAAATVKLFGLEVWAVRLPSLLAGVLIVLGVGALVRQLWPKAPASFYYLSLVVATISPWAITMSRAAWESNLATALILWGVVYFLHFVRGQKRRFLLLAVLLLSLSTYAYHAARLAAPLAGVLLVGFYLYTRKGRIDWRAALFAAVLAAGLLWPIAHSLTSSVGQQRIAETSIFHDLSVIERSNELRVRYQDQWWGYLISHRYLLFAVEIAGNVLDHFRLDYLFVSGDRNPRHSIQQVGQLYYLDGLLLVIGLCFLWRQRRRLLLWLLALWLVLLLPAALTTFTPHALRSLAALPIYLLLISVGAWQLLEWGRTKKALLLVVAGLYLAQFAYFYYHLQLTYPLAARHEWQYGYEEMVAQVAAVENQYQSIYITREQGRPAMYYFFYRQIDPRLVQAANATVSKDQGEFLEFKQLQFIDRAEQIERGRDHLLVAPPAFVAQQLDPNNYQLLSCTDQQVWCLYAQ